MKVELKTIKITKSLIMQLSGANYHQMITYQCLGFVSVILKGKKLKLILFYQPTHNTLVKKIYPNKIEKRTQANGESAVYYISDIGFDVYTDPTIDNDTLCEKLTAVKFNADKQGQIF